MNLKKIFQAFPAPKFLDIPYAGIMISDTYVRCISFNKKNKRFYLYRNVCDTKLFIYF